MNALLSLTASCALAALGLWLFGGPLLRLGGVLLAVTGLWLTASTGSPMMAAASVLGGVAWLAGHWLFAVRHHYFCSPLARRIFVRVLPAQFDPTRGWGVPNVPRGGRRCRDSIGEAGASYAQSLDHGLQRWPVAPLGFGLVRIDCAARSVYVPPQAARLVLTRRLSGRRRSQGARHACRSTRCA
jgi:hypothetical protein